MVSLTEARRDDERVTDDAGRPDEAVERRLAALATYAILDTPAEPGFDDIVSLASRLCRAPIALVSLLDRDRQWFKARTGVPFCETPMSQSICAHALRAGDLLVIPDLTQDERTRANTLVTAAPFVRFYAGAALETPDLRRIGTLCVLDTVPRPDGLTAEQGEGLRALARQVMTLLELRRVLAERDQALADRALAEQDMRRVADRHAALLSVQETISRASGQFEAILDIVATGVLRLIPGAEGAAVDIRDEMDLVCRAGAGSLSGQIGGRLPMSDSLSGLSLVEGRTLHTGDAASDTRVNAALTRALAVRSIMVAPIARHGEFVGVLKAQSRLPHVFVEEDVLALQLLVGAMTMGLSDVAATQSVQDLRANEELLRLAQQAGQIGTFDTDIERSVTRGSDQFWRLFGLEPQAEAPTNVFAALVLPEDRQGTTTDERRRAGLDATTVEYRVRRADTGAVRWIARSADYVLGRDGRRLRLIGTAQDITQRKQAEARQAALVSLGDRLRDLDDPAGIAFAAADILGQALGVSRAAYASVDVDKATVEVERDWTAPGVASRTGRHALADEGLTLEAIVRGDVVAVADLRAVPASAAVALPGPVGVASLSAIPLREHGRLVALIVLHDATPREWLAADLDFALNVADRTRAAMERVRADERRTVLHHELNHRLKNTLAMVQAIAMQTLRGAPSVEVARSVLSARLIALSQAHDLLVDGGAERTPLSALLKSTATLHGGEGQQRFHLDGVDLEIGRKAALFLALMLHELATNAVKYGALSRPEGSVAVTWTVREGTDFHLQWLESGGPPVAAPTRKGFGSRLIERGVAGAVDGQIAIDYAATGLVCTLAAPMRGMLAD